MGHGTYARSASLMVVALLALAAVAPAAVQGTSTTQPSSAAVSEVITLGADTEVFRDDFGVVGYWAVSDNDAGSIEYEDGALRFQTTTAPNPRWN